MRWARACPRPPSCRARSATVSRAHTGGPRASGCFLGQSPAWLPGAQQPQQGAPHPLAPSGLGGSAAARSGGGVQRRKPSGRVGATSDQGLGLHSTFWQERRAPGHGWGPAVAPGALTKGLSPLPEGARGGAVRPSALHGLKAPGPSPLQVRATWPCSRRRRARCPPRP